MLHKFLRKPSTLSFSQIARKRRLYRTMSGKQINLMRGWPNPSLLPKTALKNAAVRVLEDEEVSTPGLMYGPDPGYGPLRKSVARWLGGFYGVKGCKGMEDENGEDRIVITGGASQNLACVLQVYADPAVTRVWMVAPCYYLACRIFEDAGLGMRAVGEGAEGVDLEALERGLEEERARGEKMPIKNPKPFSKIYKNIIYCVPTFSNPSSQTMSLATRQSLVRLARKYDALLISDDVYDFLQWPLSPTTSPSALTSALLPRLVDVDRTLDPILSPSSFGNAMSNGSFSKIAGPGLRTGWAESTPKFAYGLSQCGSTCSGGAPSHFAATIVDSMLRTGALGEHIAEVLKPAYQRRHRILVDAVQEELVPLGVRVKERSLEGSEVFGGYFVWLKLPEGVSATVVVGRCKEEENLVVAPGTIFEVMGDKSLEFGDCIRLCFSYEGLDELKEGVERLGRVLKRIQEGSGGADERGQKQTEIGEFK